MRNRLLLLFVAASIAACGPGSASHDPDGAPVDAERVIDAGPPPDALGPDFGQACTTATDCEDGGVCVDGPTGDVCTYGCNENCPLGWECRVTEIDGVLSSLCLPQIVSQCVPCTADDQCPGGACIDIGGGSYCLPSCFEGACPEGYSCGDDPSGEHPGGFCIPDTGSCDCNADNDGNVRTCMDANGVGTCYGVEICDGTTGWGSCNAPTATPEVCDGADNDCDFLIDDGVAGGASCDITNASGTCPGVSLCTGVGGIICQGQTPSTEVCDYTDNNCDGAVDEGYSGVGDLCSDGDGTCERFGVIRCDGAGTGTECSAVAGAPTTELCNALDDDCMGDIDEDFTTLGDACSDGVGVCQRQGNLICNGAQTGVACSATAASPGTETCNTLDDDCDTKVDENWKTGGVYTSNTACGSCAVDCTVIYGLAHANGTCNSTGTPTCQMNCAGGYYNLNAVVGDGCEFLLDPNAIYVSVNDTGANDDGTCGLGPVGTVAGYHPCASINYGMGRAAALSKSKVLVANGIYAESITVVAGRSMLGGYLPNQWSRDVAATGTMLTGVKTAFPHQMTVDASSITSATTFEGFVVFGPVNANTSGNSYAIYASGSNGTLTLSNNVVFGGRGGPGSAGSTGGTGTVGGPGTGRSSDPTGFDVKDLAGAGCQAANNRASSGGATATCGGNGGNGGGNTCPITSTCTCSGTGCSTCTFTEASGLDGVNGLVGPGTGGGTAGTGADAGYDMVLYHGTDNSDHCYVSSDPTLAQSYGLDGNNGGDGTSFAGGAGCSTTAGSIAGGHWQGGAAAGGAAGGNGGGGGGGGAGGGSRCAIAGCTGSTDNFGGHGGGGGAGGCGGAAGGAAGPGGAAFGIFIVGSTVGPVISGNRIVLGEGGVGGTGGTGGGGGGGGLGGAGGIENVAVFCANLAGRGGNGGDGGHGSGGGGGCGGISRGIYTSGISATPNYCTSAGNTFSGGGGGAGGSGGYSQGNAGTAGTAGNATNCVNL